MAISITGKFSPDGSFKLVDASDVELPTGIFTGNLSDSDTDVQTALETIDQLALGGTLDHASLTSGLDYDDSGHTGFMPTINVVTDHAADNTGVADATTEIQSAIDAVEANNGGVVFFPAGTYRIDSALTINNSNVEMVGSGAGWDNNITGATIFDGSNTANGTILEIHSVLDGVNTLPITNVKVRNVYFSGENGSSVPISDIGISVLSAPQTIIEYCTFRGFLDSAIKCDTHDSAVTGTGIQLGNNNMVIQHCHIFQGQNLVNPGTSAGHCIYYADTPDAFYGNSLSNINNCFMVYGDNAAFKDLNSDHCYHRRLFFLKAGNGTASYAVELHGGNGTYSKSRKNTFLNCTGMSVKAFGTTTYTNPSIDNRIIALDVSNSALSITCEAGATVWYDTDQGDFGYADSTGTYSRTFDDIVNGIFDTGIGIGTDPDANAMLNIAKTVTTSTNLILSDITNNSTTATDFAAGHTSTARYTGAVDNTSAFAAQGGQFLGMQESSNTAEKIGGLSAYALTLGSGNGAVGFGWGARAWVQIGTAGNVFTDSVAYYARDVVGNATAGGAPNFAQYYADPINSGAVGNGYFLFYSKTDEDVTSGNDFFSVDKDGNTHIDGTLVVDGVISSTSTASISTSGNAQSATVATRTPHDKVKTQGSATRFLVATGVTGLPQDIGYLPTALLTPISELNQLNGLSAAVTDTNLNKLTGGGNADSLHTHNPVGSIYKAGNQLITTSETTSTVVTLDTAHTTLPSGFSIVSNGIQCATAGTYKVEFHTSVRDDSAGVADEVQAVIFVDGVSGFPSDRGDFSGVAGCSISLSGFATVTTSGANEVIDLRVVREGLNNYRVWGFYTSLVVTQLY